MRKFEKGFFIGAATAAHQVEGNNTNSDYWAQEQLPHSSFLSGCACCILLFWCQEKRTPVHTKRRKNHYVPKETQRQ